MKDKLKKQSYYNKGIEAKDYINSHDLNFNLGNVIKYGTRCNYKNDKEEDLIKAKNYIDYELERISFKRRRFNRFRSIYKKPRIKKKFFKRG